MKLFVCGSCSITDKEWIYSKIEECVSENNFTDITLLEGEAKGVDLIAKEWAVARGIPVKEYPPDVKHYLHDIMMAEKHQKPYKVCLFTTKLYSESVRFVLENRKEILRSSEDLRIVYPKFREAVFKHLLEVQNGMP